ncbi:unnamed protein product [Rotaria sp. Silwood1]|nr:unnamed protein product [Rotaria sp. Silwood1]
MPVQVLIDRLVDNVHRLATVDTAGDILRFIFYPFGTRALDHGSQLLAIKMAKLMQWWLTVKPSEAPSKGLLELIRERRIIVIQQIEGRLIPR